MTKKDAYEQLTKDNMPERSETSFFGRFLGKLFPLILLGASFDLFYRLFLFQNLPKTVSAIPPSSKRIRKALQNLRTLMKCP